MLCPICRTKFHEVKESRKVAGLVARRRRCFNGHSFKTVEQVLPLEFDDKAVPQPVTRRK